MQIPTGTTEVKRTTVPFMYNLDKHVEGLDVVDFPGVDDEDDTIGDLADLLVTIAQIIIFVVDYRCVCLVISWLHFQDDFSCNLCICVEALKTRLIFRPLTEMWVHGNLVPRPFTCNCKVTLELEALGISLSAIRNVCSG